MHLPRRPLPLPASALAWLAALALAIFHYRSAGWLLFAAGAAVWMRHDARRLLSSDRYGLAPALALLAYPVLAGAQASGAITFALALHALVVLLIVTSRRLSHDIAQAFSPEKGISRSI
ncbi:hypothetical protein [Duganella callida]|uniref:Uncharacterized protein n=1 Tax=Duganella callida TaxID=2561932 RepID=A0A4Y9SWU8_9BURK|nr:hypothetical protein [Duganella callida]TFW31295.1 hypothetical protein E4L98_00580 [Duganella callida]